MRKLWYAGAVIAGGVFLLGASPAQAAPQPGGTDPGQQSDLLNGASGAQQQLDNALGYTMNKTNGIRLSTTDPLGPGAPVNAQPGQNSTNIGGADMTGAVGDAQGLPGRLMSGNGQATESDNPGVPAADVVGNALPQTGSSLGELPLKHVPTQKITSHGLPSQLSGGLPTSLAGNNLPVINGLQPDGMVTDTSAPTTEQASAFGDGLPLLGGLGGMLPANAVPRNLPTAGYTGLPAGGMTVTPADTTPDTTTPDTTTPDTTPSTAPDTTATPAATAPSMAAPSMAPSMAMPSADTSYAAPKAPKHPKKVKASASPAASEAGQRAFTGESRPVSGVDPQFQ